MAIHVLALCDYYDELSVGGAEVAAREIYARLARDHEVDITVVGAVPKSRWEHSAERSLGNPRRVSVPGHDLTRLLGAQLMVAPLLRQAARRESQARLPDVVHINGLHFHSTGVGIRLAKMLSRPTVSTAHLADVAAMPGASRLAATAFDRVWAGRAARRSDRVLAVSQSVSDHLVRLGVDPGRIGIARNGVDLERFRPITQALKPPELRAVIVGRLTANKGTLHALDAVAGARACGRDVRLTVVGDGPLESQLRRRALRGDLAGAVRFAGRVPDVEQWLARADVALRPSYTEGLPLAVIESLACGTPVICSNVPGTLEVISHNRNGVVTPIGDTLALTAALIRLHDDRSTLERMSKAAVLTAASFSWSASAEAHLAAFEAVMSSRPCHATRRI
jgi:teichuronic acid biosynthesis glycosyltransferase TuaC